MDLTALEVQIFVSLALVLGAVFIALLTDFLKGNNEALRERNIELIVRQEERERISSYQQPVQQAPPVAAHRPAAAPPAAAPANAAASAASAPAFEDEIEEQFEEPVAPPHPDPVAEPITEEWATSEEMAEVDAVAERIRRMVGSPQQAPQFERPLQQQEAAEEQPAEPEPEPELEAGAESEAAQAEDQKPFQETSPVAESEDEPAEEVEPPAVSEAHEESPDVAAGEDEAAEVAPPQPDSLPVMSSKVTPIDVMAGERNAAAEAMRLARELERIAGFAAGSRGEESAAERTSQLEEPAAEAPSDQPEFPEELEESAPGDAETRVFEPSVAEQTSEPEAETEEAEEEAEAISGAPPDSIDERDEPSKEKQDPAAAVSMPDRGADHRRKLEVPTGYHEYAKLEEAIKSDAVFEGTAVSIAVNHVGGDLDEDTMRSVAEFVTSLLTPTDFACRYSSDEFLLIMPDETGAPAQRRLQYLSQRLWDYQIRSVGQQTIMFSWGAAQVVSEPIREAIVEARDRMLETKRSRERATAEIHHYRLRAAND